MTMSIRTLFAAQFGPLVMIRALIVAATVALCGPAVWASNDVVEWSPSRLVRVIVPFQAGGPIDTVARTVARQLDEKWGKGFIVENRTGAGGNIGMELVAKAPADGYTFGMASGGTHGANLTLYGSKLPFDPVKDFTPITML